MNGRMATSIVRDTMMLMLQAVDKMTRRQPTRMATSRTARMTKRTLRLDLKPIKQIPRSRKIPNRNPDTKNYEKSTACRKLHC